MLNFGRGQVDLTSVDGSPTRFDYGGAGFAVQTGWVGSSTALLVRLQGSEQPTLFGVRSGDGFADLAALDSNGDGVIDAKDTAFGQLDAWFDTNHNGVIDAGELKPLSDLGIKSLNVAASALNETVNGNTLVSGSLFTKDDGTVGQIAEVDFATHGERSTFTPPAGFTVDALAQALPQMHGYGLLPELRSAMSLDPTLERMVLQFVVSVPSMSAQQFDAGFTAILYRWAGVDGVDPNAWGPNVDGRQFEFVLKLFGIDPNGANEYTAADPNWHNGPLDRQEFQAIKSVMEIRFAAQLGPILSTIFPASMLSDLPFTAFAKLGFDAEGDTVSLDLKSVLAALSAGAPSDLTAAATYYAFAGQLLSDLATDVYNKLGHESGLLLSRVALDGAEVGLSDVALQAIATAMAGSPVSVINLSASTGAYTAPSGTNVFSLGAAGGAPPAGDTQAGPLTITGSGGSDVFVYRSNFGGNVVLTDVNASLDLVDLRLADVSLERQGDALVIVTKSTGATITVTAEFAGGSLSSLQFADGQVLGAADIASLTPLYLGPDDATVQLADGNMVVVAGTGNAVITGGSGNDTFIYGSADGNLTINDHNYRFDADRNNLLKFSDLNTSDVTLTRTANDDLIVIINSTSRVITIGGMFNSTTHDGIQQIAFADGTVWDKAKIMAAAPYRPTANFLPDSGSTTDLSGATGLYIGDYGDSRNDESILWNSTGGSDTVQLHDYSGPERSTLNLGDLKASDVTLTRVGEDLQVIDKASGTVLTVHDQFANNNSGVASIVFADGSTLAGSAIVAPYRPTANFLPDSGSTTDLSGATGLYIGDYGDSRNDESILWNSTGGSDTVQLHDYSGPERSTLNLGDLKASDVTLTRVGEDLQVIDRASGTVLTVHDQFANNNSGVASIVFADGSTLAGSAIVAPYRPTANFLPDSGSTTDLSGATGLYIGDYGDSRNDESILWNSTGGSDTVQLHDYSGPERSTLNLGDLKASDVTLTRVGEDLQVIDKASGTVLTVHDQFANNNSGVASIVFADGSTLAGSAIVAPYRPTANFLPDSGSTTDLSGATGLYIGDYGDSRNDESILWNSTGGSDTVQLHDYSGPERSTLNLGDLKASDVTLTRVGEDLQVIDRASGTVLTVHDQFANNNSGVASIVFADGSTLAGSAIVAPYRPTANFLPDSGSTTDLSGATGLYIGDYGDSRNDESILWNSTGGSDTVQLHDYSGPERSTLNLGDLKASDVTLTRVGEDLQVIDKASGTVLTVHDQFANNNSGVASIVFADGSTLAGSAIVAPYRPTANFLPDSGSTTDLSGATGLYIGDYGDSRNDESILWNSTGGSDTVQLHDYSGPERSTLNLGDLKASDVTLTRVGEDLQVIDRASGTVLTVHDQFANNNSGVASIVFADGSTLAGSAIVAPYRPTANFLPDSGSTTDLSGATGLYIGDYGDSRNDESILWNSTGGSDTVQLHDYSGPERSTLNLGDLKASDVTLTRVGEDLQVIDKASGTVLTVHDQFANNNSGVASIAFADGSTLNHDQIAAAAKIVRPVYYPAAGTALNGLYDAEIVLGSGDGTTINGQNQSYGLAIDWSSTSGSASAWWYSSANDAYGSDPSVLNLTDLSLADVTLARIVDNGSDDLVITNKATGKTLTFLHQFSGVSGDNIGSIRFADGSTLNHDQIAAAAKIVRPVYHPAAGTALNGLYDAEIVLGSGDGTTINGQNQSYGLAIDWSSTSGSASAWWYSSANDAYGSDPSVLNLTDLSLADVTLARIVDNGSDDLVITNKATGKTLTFLHQFSGVSGDNIGSIRFADGSTLNHDQIASQASLNIFADSTDITLKAPDGAAVLTAGKGDDTFIGGNGDDTFVYVEASGNLTVSDQHQPGWGMNTNTLRLTDLNANDLSVLRQNNDLLIAITSTGKFIDVVGEFNSNGQDGIQRIQFASGTTWTKADIVQKTQNSN